MKFLLAVLVVLPVVFGSPYDRSFFGSLASAFKNLGEDIKHTATNVGHKIETGVVGAAHTVANGVSSAANTVKNEVVNAANTVAHTLTDVEHKVEAGVVDAAKTVANTAHEVVDGIGDAAHYLSSHTSEILAFVNKLRLHIDPKLGKAGCMAVCPTLAAATEEFAPVTMVVCNVACPVALEIIG